VTRAPTAAVPIGPERDFAISSRLASRETPAAGKLAGVRTGAGRILVRVPARTGGVCLLYNFQTGSGAAPSLLFCG
jgi:hypothetical protein